MRKQSAKYCLPCITHKCCWLLRSVFLVHQWASSMECWADRGTFFFFGHGGNLLAPEEILWGFDKWFLLIVCDTASLFDSPLLHSPFLQDCEVFSAWCPSSPYSSAQSFWGLRELWEHFIPSLFFLVLIQICLLVGMRWQGISQEESEKESCG